MSPTRVVVRPMSKTEGAARRRIAAKYLEVAEIAATEDGESVNVAVGIAVLAGIAASDAICAAALGERYAGQDHAAAVQVLKRVDAALARTLKKLVDMKPGSHYADALLSPADRDRAIRAASDLVQAARERI